MSLIPVRQSHPHEVLEHVENSLQRHFRKDVEYQKAFHRSIIAIGQSEVFRKRLSLKILRLYFTNEEAVEVLAYYKNEWELLELFAYMENLKTAYLRARAKR